MDDKARTTFDDFLKQHPEIDPEWRGLLEPTIQGAEDGLYAFILSYIFM